jgi:hypothetical protein
MSRKFFVALAILAAGFASAAPAAAAADEAGITATCSGTACDNKDPVDSGCAASGSSVASKQTSKGTFHLYYSSTCKTNWVRVPNYAGGGTRLELSVWDVPRNKIVRYYASTSAGLHYGNMVYSPGSNCAHGFADWNGGNWDVDVPSSGC